MSETSGISDPIYQPQNGLIRSSERYIPKQFRDAPIWRPWQQSVIDIMNTEPNDRTVNVIIDPDGNTGKSYLTMYLHIHNLAVHIPQGVNIMKCVIDMPKLNTYFFDPPRATSGKARNNTYRFIKDIKIGYACNNSKRFREEWFPTPHVFVFSPYLPDMSVLSADRWCLWLITPDHQLIRYPLSTHTDY